MDYKSEVVFEGTSVRIGRWRCGPDSSLWHGENITGDQPMVAFPRTNVLIHQDSYHPKITTRNDVVFYNSRQAYRRRLVDPSGDICEYFYIRPKEIASVHSSLGVPLPRDMSAPFHFDFGRCDAATFALQRKLVRCILTIPNRIDPIFVEETFLYILASLIRASAKQLQSSPESVKRSETRRRHQEVVERAKEFLVTNQNRKLTLAEIASECEISPFHLSRLFKKSTGNSIFRYVAKLRLLQAFDSVFDSRRPLTDIALQLGFSSHSHMTENFRIEFGLTPSCLRSKRPADFLNELKQSVV